MRKSPKFLLGKSALVSNIGIHLETNIIHFQRKHG
jgi:hypothetical protein